MRMLARLLLVAGTLLVSSGSWAAEGTGPGAPGNGRIGRADAFGLGLGVGRPSSVTGKYFFTSDQALDFALDFDPGLFGVHVDYLWHLAPLGHPRPFALWFYLGVGAQFGVLDDPWWYDNDGVDLGVRAPFGIAMWLRRAPFEFFFELGPEIWLFDTSAGLFSTLGFRFYF